MGAVGLTEILAVFKFTGAFQVQVTAPLTVKLAVCPKQITLDDGVIIKVGEGKVNMVKVGLAIQVPFEAVIVNTVFAVGVTTMFAPINVQVPWVQV